jgi:hypothetical protein
VLSTWIASVQPAPPHLVAGLIHTRRKLAVLAEVEPLRLVDGERIVLARCVAAQVELESTVGKKFVEFQLQFQALNGA